MSAASTLKRLSLIAVALALVAGAIALLGGSAAAAPKSNSASTMTTTTEGPWIIWGVFQAPPFDNHYLESKCQAQGSTLVHYYPQQYTAYRCVLDAPYYWRLWMQLRLPS